MRRLRLSVLCSLALLANTAQAGEEPAPVQAIWQPQEIVFYYQSFTTFYSCDSLEQKLERILRQMGVTAHVRVRSANCFQGPVSFPRAEISLISPAVATPEALAELKEGESIRELIARVRGDRDQAIDLAEQFPAKWQRVEVGKGRGSPNIESGDCELLDQVRRKILPQLAVKVLEDGTPCPRSATGMMRPRLIVEALVALPKPDDVQAAGPQGRPAD